MGWVHCLCLVSCSSHTGFCGLFSQSLASWADPLPAVTLGERHKLPRLRQRQGIPVPHPHQPHGVDKSKSLVSPSRHSRKWHKKQLSRRVGPRRDPGPLAQFGAAKCSASRQEGCSHRCAFAPPSGWCRVNSTVSEDATQCSQPAALAVCA